MRLLIGYDGSEYADAALKDLHRAGLHDVEALVLCVGEVWLPPAEMLGSAASAVREAFHAYEEQASQHARSVAEHARRWIGEHFPHWGLTAEGLAGSPVELIVERAASWRADLVVLGAHGHAAAPRMFPGSIPMGVLRYAPCSVRIARALELPEGGARRLLLPVDGSSGSRLMLDQVRSRVWPVGTQFRVLSVVDTRLIPLAIANMSVGPTCEEWSRQLADEAAERLRDAGLTAFATVERGDPKHVILEATGTWEAECIYLGARGISRSRWLQLGNVATHVAMRSGCSVEIVRAASAPGDSAPR